MTPDTDDFIFRFRLETAPSPPDGVDPLTEMFRSLFADFLEIGHFTCNGQRVTVDGFSFVNDTEAVHPLTPAKG